MSAVRMCFIDRKDGLYALLATFNLKIVKHIDVCCGHMYAAL